MRVGSVKSGSSAETSTEAGRWYRQPIVWLGGLVFPGLLAGITLTIIVATRFQDEPLPVDKVRVLATPINRDAPADTEETPQ